MRVHGLPCPDCGLPVVDSGEVAADGLVLYGCVDAECPWYAGAIVIDSG
jgi:hypothetical protein